MKIVNINVYRPVETLFARQINPKINFKGSRILINGSSCYIDMWNISDLLIEKYRNTNRPSVYIIQKSQELDNKDCNLIDNCVMLLIIDLDMTTHIDKLDFLRHKDGRYIDVRHINIGYVCRESQTCSNEWILFSNCTLI